MPLIMKKNSLNPGWTPHLAGQQRGHVMGNQLTIDGTNHIAAVVDQAGNPTIARAVKSKTAGNLEVHFVDDWDANDGAVWYVMTLVAGDPPIGGIIDYIRSTNTTVTLADVEFIL
jgi:hypothetical protein